LKEEKICFFQKILILFLLDLLNRLLKEEGQTFAEKK